MVMKKFNTDALEDRRTYEQLDLLDSIDSLHQLHVT